MVKVEFDVIPHLNIDESKKTAWLLINHVQILMIRFSHVETTRDGNNNITKVKFYDENWKPFNEFRNVDFFMVG